MGTKTKTFLLTFFITFLLLIGFTPATQCCSNDMPLLSHLALSSTFQQQGFSDDIITQIVDIAIDSHLDEHELNVLISYLCKICPDLLRAPRQPDIPFPSWAHKRYKEIFGNQTLPPYIENAALEIISRDVMHADVLVMGGGSGNNFLSSVCALMGVSMNGIITPFDNGGSTYLLQTQVFAAWNVWIPALGDIGEVLVGCAPEPIRDLMETRFLEQQQQYEGRKLGQILDEYLPRTTISDNEFLRWMDESVHAIDDAFIPEKFSAHQHSIKNLLILGSLLINGAVSKTGIDQTLFHTTILQLADKFSQRSTFMTLTSFDRADLMVTRNDKTITEGQHHITQFGVENETQAIHTLSFTGSTQTPKSHELVYRMIRGTRKLIILGPGSLYTSILANLLMSNVVQALQKRTDIPRLFVVNPIYDNEMRFHSLVDIIDSVEKVAQSSFGSLFSHIFINTNNVPHSNLAENTKEKGKELYGLLPVTDDDLTVIRQKISPVNIVYINLLHVMEKRIRAAGVQKKTILGYDPLLFSMLCEMLINGNPAATILDLLSMLSNYTHDNMEYNVNVLHSIKSAA